MPYSQFTTPESAIDRFKLNLFSERLFRDLEEVTPSQKLEETIAHQLPLAVNIGTEKARSELIVTPVLLEIRSLYQYRIGYFSGRTFNVDPSENLNGECDFILSGNSNQIVIQAPILTVVEAKNLDIMAGLGQCIAQMVGIFRFNQIHNGGVDPANLPTVLGAVTTGVLWRFLVLDAQRLIIDTDEYQLPIELDKVLAILMRPFQQYF
jgi:hypothetical protein